MNIDYPPVLTGNTEEQLRQLRSYLWRTAEALNHIIAELEEKAEAQEKKVKED